MLVVAPLEAQTAAPSFDILATVGATDYRNHVKGKEKTDLLKRRITRDTARDETPTGDGSMPAAILTVVEHEDKGSGCDDRSCEVLPELGGWVSKETAKDLEFGGDDLSAEQRRELEELAGCFSYIFSDCPCSTTLEENCIEQTTCEARP
ncbi:hypothetical protein PoB_000277900 [Plakobranchus ocellatus]|uniref:Uncharacterized protein n=1 Tax=Plakobranchus ocellatus TaxID=259542 RepID=A0AAV3XZZ6_9GAST|nr:hypothetical protein PoB_000277900 [Plakobranchus ocellatus]